MKLAANELQERGNNRKNYNIANVSSIAKKRTKKLQILNK